MVFELFYRNYVNQPPTGGRGPAGRRIVKQHAGRPTRRDAQASGFA